jgi:hypothetical protein
MSRIINLSSHARILMSALRIKSHTLHFPRTLPSPSGNGEVHMYFMRDITHVCRFMVTREPLIVNATHMPSIAIDAKRALVWTMGAKKVYAMKDARFFVERKSFDSLGTMFWDASYDLLFVGQVAVYSVEPSLDPEKLN